MYMYQEPLQEEEEEPAQEDCGGGRREPAEGEPAEEHDAVDLGLRHEDAHPLPLPEHLVLQALGCLWHGYLLGAAPGQNTN